LIVTFQQSFKRAINYGPIEQANRK